MKLKDEQKWQEYVNANKGEPYGEGIVHYAEAWANLMEARLEAGEELASIARETSHEADAEGITGFMYGAATSMLAQCWEHGEELRRWHNLEYQIRDEGEKANEEGGTLNPALMSIGGSDE